MTRPDGEDLGVQAAVDILARRIIFEELAGMDLADRRESNWPLLGEQEWRRVRQVVERAIDEMQYAAPNSTIQSAYRVLAARADQ